MVFNIAGVMAKLDRANFHADILKREVNDWFNLKPYKTSQEFNADSTQLVLFVERTDTPEPRLQDWALQFGDTIHNLRTVLDHLIYAIAVYQTGKNPPPGERSLAFITEGTHDDFAAKRSRMKPNALSSIVWAAMESVQPYNRPHPKLRPLLAILADLDNSDKHRLPNAFIATPTEVNVSVEGFLPKGVSIIGAPIPYFGEIKQRTEVLRTKFTGPAPEMHYTIHMVELVFAIWHGKKEAAYPEWMARTDAGSLLTALTDEVKAVKEIMMSAVK